MERFKKITGFLDYQVSDLGRVWSDKSKKHLKLILDDKGYLCVNLYNCGIKKRKKIHQLVAEAFLNHTPNGYTIVVDHIDNNKKNNRVDNLQLITPRKNSSKDRVGSSKYTGVSWHKNRLKWQSSIQINGKFKYLGVFESEENARDAYNKALISLYRPSK
jgi:hypothetical protein